MFHYFSGGKARYGNFRSLRAVPFRPFHAERAVLPAVLGGSIRCEHETLRLFSAFNGCIQIKPKEQSQARRKSRSGRRQNPAIEDHGGRRDR